MASSCFSLSQLEIPLEWYFSKRCTSTLSCPIYFGLMYSSVRQFNKNLYISGADLDSSNKCSASLMTESGAGEITCLKYLSTLGTKKGVRMIRSSINEIPFQ